VLIAPVLGECWGLRPACDVCRLGRACAACFHSSGAFLVCSLCATAIARAMVIRVAFVQDAQSPDPLPVA
jgi:hypothetical protein